MRYRSNLDATYMLEGIVRYLLWQLHCLRSKNAGAVSRKSREVSFKVLTDYLGLQARTTHRRFDRLARESSRPTKPSTVQLQ